MSQDLQYLNARETQIVLYLTQGLTNTEIGQKMHLSVHTIKYHLGRIYQKQGVNNRAMLIKAYYDRRGE
jgi:DNA-binding CsgD family transcriptional regulator